MELEEKTQEAVIAELSTEVTRQQAKIDELLKTAQHYKTMYENEKLGHRYLEGMYNDLLEKVLEKV